MNYIVMSLFAVLAFSNSAFAVKIPSTTHVCVSETGRPQNDLTVVVAFHISGSTVIPGISIRDSKDVMISGGYARITTSGGRKYFTVDQNPLLGQTYVIFDNNKVVYVVANNKQMRCK